jgi:hypothetical protein
MNLQKEEKKFWQKHFRIKKLEDIPKRWNIIRRIDSEEEDDFFYFLSLRVASLSEIHLKQTLVTDQGIKHISKFKDLEILYIRNHDKITKKSIPYFNKMMSLQSLNITKTNITLTDLSEILDNKNLKEVFLDSNDDDTDENILENGYLLKQRMPNCNIYLDCSSVIDTFNNLEKPIF